jgi:hypothetical protein
MINNNQVEDFKKMVFLTKGGKMADKGKEKKPEEFSELVNAYHDAIAKDYRLPQGEEEDCSTPRQKIIKAFKGSTVLKIKMLRIVSKEFSAEERGEDKRWDSWIMRQKLSLLAELIKKL